MADGLDWLLNRAGLAPTMIAHFFHLDDDEIDPRCSYCLKEKGGQS